MMRHDLAIVITTVCRESLLRAVHSVYRQQTTARIQILVGVDVDQHGRGDELEQRLRADCPAHISLFWLNPGYSTSRRHGGPHSCCFGGSLRSVLTLLADAEVVMVLDDDDWLAPSHCRDILSAIEGHEWAYAYSIYSDGNSGEGICVDGLESVGPDRGICKNNFGGFVRPSGMAINKLALLHLIPLWADSPFPDGDGEDRLMFGRLRHHSHRCTGQATVYYALDPKDWMHTYRLRYMAEQGIEHLWSDKQGSCR